MGSSSYSSQAANFFTRSNATKSTNQVFTQNTVQKVADTMSPKGLKFRESRDSAAHPNSVPVMLMLDVTGSMGQIPEKLVKDTFPTIMDVMIKHGVADPQVLFGAIGDGRDQAPLQVGQFESGAAELNTCLSSVWLEGNGRGNMEEAYLLAWLVAARHTSLDSYEKRGQKGVLITVGDEASHSSYSGQQLRDLMGYGEADTVTDAQLLAEAQRSFDVFHIHVQEGSYPTTTHPHIANYWRNLLGECFIVMEDKNTLAEIIGTTVAMLHGADLNQVVSGFDANTAGKVSTALAAVSNTLVKKGAQTDVIKF